MDSDIRRPTEGALETYIVRIYRTDREEPGLAIGVVEHVGSEGKRGFTSTEELMQLLNLPESKVAVRPAMNRRSRLIPKEDTV